MIGQSGRGSCQTWVGIAGALLLAVLAPSPAEAACGDHVRFGPASAATPKSDAPAPIAPCHGPTCSRRDHDPLPAPAPAPSTNHQELASLSPLPALPGGGGIERLAESEPLCPNPLSTSVFHPPRN
jgi:hypothetical protein